MQSGPRDSGSKTLTWLETLVQDLRFAFRLFLRKPAFSFIVVAVLALGIGANTAMFSIIDAVLLRPLPYKDSDRLVVVWQSSKQHRNTGEWFDKYREFQVWQQKSQTFEKLAVQSWAEGAKRLVWQGKARKVLALPASVDFFSMLGVSAYQGRTFEPSDLNQGCTVVLAHSFWQNDLGAPQNIVGGHLALDQKECRVAGIMPKGFSFYPAQTALWTLITTDSVYMKDPWRSEAAIFGRLRAGVTRAAAQSELETLQQNILAEAPADLSLPRNAVPVVLDMKSEFTWLAGRNLRLALLVLLATVFFVLLIACVNVANLLLAHAADRQRELAIRTSLGCVRSRLIRQLLVESMLLSFAGALLGTLMAAGAVQLFRTRSPVELPPGNPVELNWQVLVFTIIMAVLAAVSFGVVPAWRASSLNVSEALKEAGQSLASGRGAHRTRSILVVGEVALSLILLAGAGLLLESLAKLAATPLGFRTDHLLTASVDLPDARYKTSEQRVQFFQKLTEQTAAIAGVEQASISSSFYLAGSNVLAVEGREFSPEHSSFNVAQQTVEDNFFDMMGVPLLQGREFISEDRLKTQQVAIVNQELADKYFPNQDPIGQQIKLAKPESKEPWLTIVGVAGNVKTTSVFQEMGYIIKPAVYRPLSQNPPTSISLLMRTHRDANALGSPLQKLVRSLDDEVTLSDVKTMQDRLYDLQAEPRFRTILLSGFAGVALLLAALGIYGLLMQSVIRRTREIGIRMALGASRNSVTRIILRQTFTTVLIGVALGLMATVLLARFAAGLLYEVRPGNPEVLAGVSLLLLIIAIFASYIPARRATRIDPLQALRNE